MALVPKSVLKTVGTTAASLFPSGVAPRATGLLVIRALTGNSAPVFIGGPEVDLTTEIGFSLAAGVSIVIPIPEGQYLDLSKLWADGADASEGLSLTYLEPAL